MTLRQLPHVDSDTSHKVFSVQQNDVLTGYLTETADWYFGLSPISKHLTVKLNPKYEVVTSVCIILFMCLYSGYIFYFFIGPNFAYQLTAKYNTKHQSWGENNIAGPDWFSVRMCIFNTEAIRYASQYTANDMIH